jgi:hypothetical protein
MITSVSEEPAASIFRLEIGETSLSEMSVTYVTAAKLH